MLNLSFLGIMDKINDYLGCFMLVSFLLFAYLLLFVAIKEEIQKRRLRRQGKLTAAEEETSVPSHLPVSPIQVVKMVSIGNIQVNLRNITYIESSNKKGEDLTSDSRKKIIHYANSTRTDTVAATFNEIANQVKDDYLIQVNKQVMVNLMYIQKLDGINLYLQGVDTIFVVSEKYMKQLNERFAIK